jgi:hypothetical protein
VRSCLVGDDAKMRHVLSSAAFALLSGIVLLGPSIGDARAAPAEATCIPADQCCKVCDKGYACGNTCISRAKQCHKGRGCACNASEICGG